MTGYDEILKKAEKSLELRTAFNLRQTADYSFVVDITEEEARENIRRAEEFLEFTRRYLTSKGFLEG
ncbi:MULTISPECIES: HEPN domain-containing protein [Thermococcus]|uniref:HEPN domain-containing protein n=1 Tax=Thermococcus TaxID=2263 RepID=UPI0014308946|nr:MULTISPECIES: HEPN domain-containing protein [Thermococcus]NJE49010.1 HEPN domain-containing protein [Thermococcus sp. 9N3]CAI1491939.1 conserved protein of unknown function [Thermococcus nautili]